MALRKVERPSKEKLEEMLQTNSMVKIGHSFGVSDKAVKKWILSYGITAQKRDVAQLAVRQLHTL